MAIQAFLQDFAYSERFNFADFGSEKEAEGTEVIGVDFPNQKKLKSFSETMKL